MLEQKPRETAFFEVPIPHIPVGVVFPCENRRSFSCFFWNSFTAFLTRDVYSFEIGTGIF